MATRVQGELKTKWNTKGTQLERDDGQIKDAMYNKRNDRVRVWTMTLGVENGHDVGGGGGRQREGG